MKGRTKCERYSRIVGYLRPLDQWNEGKQSEWKDRKMFKLMSCEAENISLIKKHDNKRLTENNLD